MSVTPSSTPGSLALENIKKRDKEIAEFRKPAPYSSKKKPKILTEEKYIEELSKLIQRDFFPDLEKLRAQNEYLDAMERKDYARMEVIRAKYSERPTERSGRLTPATFETPASLAGNSTPQQCSDTPKSVTSNTSKMSKASSHCDGKSIADKHTLDSFLQAYTSEDNQSFQEIIDTADQKLRQKFSVLFSEEKISAEKMARALTLPSIDKQFDEPDPMRKIETWTYTNKNSIMYTPNGVELTEQERIEAVNLRQLIHHNATRFSSNPFNEEKSIQKASSDSGNSALQTANEKTGGDANGAVFGNGKAVPQIRGFELVKTPSPRPGEAFSPLMTWGEIEGTPFRLDGADTPVRSNAGPSFKINENSRRENIGLALAEKVGEKMRAQKQRAIDTARKNMNSPFIRSNMERLASMSPAARRLATTKLGIRTPILTPSPFPSPALLRSKRKTTNASSLRKSSSGISITPKNTASGMASAPGTAAGTPKSTLTDDLLKIPTKRLKASDFF